MLDTIFSWLGFTWWMFYLHAPITVPTVIIAFLTGYRWPHEVAVVLILITGVLCGVLMPYVPWAARGAEGLVYIALPIIVPIFVLVPYAIGRMLRPEPTGVSRS